MTLRQGGGFGARPAVHQPERSRPPHAKMASHGRHRVFESIGTRMARKMHAQRRKGTATGDWTYELMADAH